MMKKLLLICCILGLWGQSAQALTEIQNAMWYLAAQEENYVSQVATVATSLDLNYRGQSDITSTMLGWLKVQSANEAGIVVLPNEVYELFLSKYNGDSFKYSATVSVADDHEAPQNAAVDGSTLSCDEHATKAVRLYRWLGGVFTEMEADPVCSAGTCSFSPVPVGTWVLGYTGNEFPTLFLTVE